MANAKFRSFHEISFFFFFFIKSEFCLLSSQNLRWYNVRIWVLLWYLIFCIWLLEINEISHIYLVHNMENGCHKIKSNTLCCFFFQYIVKITLFYCKKSLVFVKQWWPFCFPQVRSTSPKVKVKIVSTVCVWVLDDSTSLIWALEDILTNAWPKDRLS